MNLKPDETFCVNSWCRKVYKKDNNIFSVCPSCDKKELESLAEFNKKPTINIQQNRAEEQKQKIIEAIKIINSPLIGISMVTEYLNKNRTFPKIRCHNSTVKGISATTIRKLMNEMTEKGKLEKAFFSANNIKYKLLE